MTVQEAVDILLRVRDIQEPYPSTDEIDEAITIVTEALDINNVSRKEAKIVIDGIDSRLVSLTPVELARIKLAKTIQEVQKELRRYI